MRLCVRCCVPAAVCPLSRQAGSDPDELHPTEGFAPLHAAVSSEASRTEVIRLLLAAGADVNLLRSANPIWSPLMYAATRGSLEHLQLLLGELCLLAGGWGICLVLGVTAAAPALALCPCLCGAVQLGQPVCLACWAAPAVPACSWRP